MSPKGVITGDTSSSAESGSESESSSDAAQEQQPSDSEDSHSHEYNTPSKSNTTTTSANTSHGRKGLSSLSEDGSRRAEATGSDSQEDGFSRRKHNIREILRTAAEQPDLYNVRRSGRQRKEVNRLVIQSDEEEKRKRGRGGHRRKSTQSWGTESEDGSSDSESSAFSDGYRPQRTTRRNTRGPGRPKSSRPLRAATRRGPSRQAKAASSSNDESESHSSSEEVAYRGRNKKSSRGSKRGNNKPVSGKPRQSTRGATSSSKKNISYKEDSEEVTDSDDLVEVDYAEEEFVNNAETIEKVIAQRRGKAGAIGSKTTFYNMMDQGDPNALFDPEHDESEVQYLIKWKHWSHIHNTWESEASLREQKINGMKKLENFQKKQTDIDAWRRVANPEDVEYFDCQKEIETDLLAKYTTVERIITHTVPKNPAEYNGFPEYLVKWEGLPYSECTWEDGKLIADKFHVAIENYNLRQKSQKIPSKICKVLKSRPKFHALKNQPDFIANGGEDGLLLRDYQMEGLNWLVHAWCRHNSVILADEMGLGKTIQTLSFISYLMNTYQCYGPYLLVVPLSTIVTWQLEFQKWTPEINVVVYIGDITSRQMIRDHEWQHSGNKRLKFNVLITTYEILLKDKSFLGSVSWAMLGVDEAHRLKNDDSLLYKSLVNFDTYHRMLITGTPLQNSLKELWSLLHFIMPEKFDDWAEFEYRHQDADATGFAKLHKELEPYLLRRVKKDVEKSLPSKTEQILRVEMSKSQKQYYKWILTKNYRALSKGVKGSIGSFINLVMELKKCCNHTFLVRQPDEEDEMGRDRLELVVKNSGKMILLDKLLLRLKEAGHRVLIFSQMVRMLDIIQEYLQMRHLQFQRLDGSVRGDLRKQAMDHFNADGSQDFCFLLSTRAGGLGVNLATADTVIIFDSDWNPQNDLQAQARAHRIGQKKQVSVYRLVTKCSVEEDIVERAKKKMVLDHLVIQSMDTTGKTVLNRNNAPSSMGSNNPFNKEELNAILKFGAEELFKDDENEDEGELQVDLDQILKRAEMRQMEEDENAASELLSQFKVVSIDNMEDEELERRGGSNMEKLWEDIIPEDERKKIEAEEDEQRLREMNLGPRERKQITDLHKFLNSDEEGKGRKHKKRKDDSESEDASEEDSEDDKPKRKGRAKGRKSSVKGFTNAEIRLFIKSYKKFGRPMERLEAIAGDAELNEKSQTELRQLAEQIQEMCESAMKEYEEKKEEEKDVISEGKKGRDRGPTFKLGSVTINAKTVLQSISDLEPLCSVMPADKNERKKYKIDFHVRTAHFDCPWDETDDANLLRGVYEYGYGSWEYIKMDPDFNLHDKILPESNLKPQAKHLQVRVDNLLRLFRKHMGTTEEVKGKKCKSKKKPPLVVKEKENHSLAKGKHKSKEFVESESSEEDHEKGEKDKENLQKSGSPQRKKKEKKPKPPMKKASSKEEEPVLPEDMEEGEVLDDRTVDKKKRKKKKKTAGDGPMHFTTAKPISVAVEAAINSELSKEAFTQCKEKMRPVKAALKALDNPDAALSEKEQLVHTRSCLLKIGDRINECLKDYKDPDGLKAWRNNLWLFVSQFTAFDATRLHKLYKHAVKKREEDREKNKYRPDAQEHRQSSGYGGSHQQHSSQYNRHPHHQSAKKRPSDDRRDRDEYRPPNKRAPPDVYSDTSRDGCHDNHQRHFGHSGSGGGFKGSGLQSGGRDNAHKGDRFHEVKDEKWQVSSPLQRPDEADRRNRYDSSYSRMPNSFAKFDRRDRDRNQQRYNKEHHRRDYGGYGSHSKGEWSEHGGGNYGRGDYGRGEYRNPRSDRPDYRQEHGFYGHRPPADDPTGEDRKFFYDRKRRPPDEYHTPESHSKDPRIRKNSVGPTSGGGDHPPVEHPRTSMVGAEYGNHPIPVINSPVPLMALSPASTPSTPQDYMAH